MVVPSSTCSPVWISVAPFFTVIVPFEGAVMVIVRRGGITANTASIVRSSSTVTVAGLSVVVVVPTLKCLKLYPVNAPADRVIFSPCSTLSLVCSSTEVVVFFTVRVPCAAGGVLMVIVYLMGSNSASIAISPSTG